MHFIHVYFISKDSFNFHSAIHQLEGCDLLCKCWRAWGHSGDAGRLCWQSPLPRARALRDAACLAQRFSRGVFLLNLRERFEANCTLLSHNALDAEGAQLISSACRLFAAIRPIFPWAFKHVWGEAQAKLRKDWVGKKKKIFEGTYFIVSIFRGITLNVYPVPFSLIFILEQLRRQKGRACWHQSVSLEVRQEHMKALADNAK